MEVSIVVDVDDTLCWNKFRDYENAMPNKDVINKVNECYRQGFNIILYTSRGMYSHHNDVEAIDRDYRQTLENWLSKNGVRYTKLIFGKPLGDLYLDDKGININDFLNKDIKYITQGGSNKEFVRLGNISKKELENENEVRKVKDFCNLAKDANIHTQEFISSLYNYVYLSWIDGESLALKEINGWKYYDMLLEEVNKMSKMKFEVFNVEFLTAKLVKHIGNDDFINKRIDYCIHKLHEYEDTYKENASLSHGDLIFDNVVIGKDKKLYLIDPRFNIEASTYLLDYANIRKSLDGYDSKLVYNIPIQREYSTLRDDLDAKLKEKGVYEATIVLEYMFILRLYNYRKDNPDDMQKVYSMLTKIEEEMGWKIN